MTKPDPLQHLEVLNKIKLITDLKCIKWSRDGYIAYLGSCPEFLKLTVRHIEFNKFPEVKTLRQGFEGIVLPVEEPKLTRQRIKALGKDDSKNMFRVGVVYL